MSNTAIWDALAKTDPAHTKKFSRSGGFKGTAVKPIYMTRKMTEQFGPAGVGWGMTAPTFQTVAHEGQVLVYCTVGVWHGNRDQIVYGVGGDHAVGKNKHGLFHDDEAFKKAYTDALGNAMKQIGMAADIHMGQHDDDKYVREVAAELAAEEPRNKSVRDADWKDGPCKTRGDMRTMFGQANEDLKACNDLDMLAGFERSYEPFFAQLRHNSPTWWDSETDPPGMKQRIDRMHKHLAAEDARRTLAA